MFLIACPVIGMCVFVCMCLPKKIHHLQENRKIITNCLSDSHSLLFAVAVRYLWKGQRVPFTIPAAQDLKGIVVLAKRI